MSFRLNLNWSEVIDGVWLYVAEFMGIKVAYQSEMVSPPLVCILAANYRMNYQQYLYKNNMFCVINQL